MDTSSHLMTRPISLPRRELYCCKYDARSKLLCSVVRSNWICDEYWSSARIHSNPPSNAPGHVFSLQARIASASIKLRFWIALSICLTSMPRTAVRCRHRNLGSGLPPSKMSPTQNGSWNNTPHSFYNFVRRCVPKTGSVLWHAHASAKILLVILKNAGH